MKINYFLRVLTLCFFSSFFAQGNPNTPKVSTGYVFSQFGGTYSEIIDGTVLGNTSSDNEVFVDPSNLLGTTADLSQGTGFPIDFFFDFNGVTFDKVAICTNGWISFGKSNLVIGQISPSPLNQFADGDSDNKHDFGKNDELRFRVAGLACNLVSQPTSTIRVKTIGTAPSRTLVVQWKNFRPSSVSQDGTDHNYNFQIRLNEGTNIVDVVYGDMTFGINGFSAQVGLGGADETDYNNRWISSQASDPGSWADSDPGFVNSNGCAMVNTLAVPAPGTTYRWSPTTLAKNTFTFSELKVYPNEVNDQLFISNNKEIQSIQIYDVFGKQVMSKEINDFSASVNLSNFSSGNYLIKLLSGNQSKVVRIIKK